MKRKLRIVIDCGDTFCAGCEHVNTDNDGTPMCGLLRRYLEMATSKPKRHAKCLEAEGMR